MQNIHLLILENQAIYGQRLASYLGHHEKSPFIPHLVTNHPAEASMIEKADLFLISSGLIDLYPELHGKEELVILDEDGISTDGNCCLIYKYQSADLIFDCLMELYLEKGRKNLKGRGGNGKLCITGIFTAVNSEESDIEVERICSMKREKSLYLDMQPVSSWIASEEEEKKNLSTLLYYVCQRKKHIGSRLSMLVVSGLYDAIPPAELSSEIWDVGKEDWQYLFDGLRSETDYQDVYLNFGTGLIPPVLVDLCDRILLLSGADLRSNKIVDAFRNAIGKSAGEDIAKKMEVIVLREREGVDEELSGIKKRIADADSASAGYES